MRRLLARRAGMAVRTFSALFVSAALALPAFAQAPTAAALLAKVKDAYTAAPSVSLTFVQTYTPAGFPATTPETGRVALQAPDQVRFDYDGKEGKVFTFDGASARQYVAADKQLVVKTLGPSERGRLPIVFLESPERLLERYDAAVAPKQNGLWEVVLTPKTAGDPKSLSLLVNGEGDVKRLTIVDAGGNQTTFTFTLKTPGRKRPAADFTLAPPPGTNVIAE
jgi:outer membrane lipoprotein-sorting protein